MQFNAPTIIFTSNVHYREWYPFAEKHHKDALDRRFIVVEHMNKPFVYANTMHPYIDLS